MPQIYRAIGLMSGTVLDGEIDVALIETDGYGTVTPLKFMGYPYASDVRDKVRACFGRREPDRKTRYAEKLVTDLHIAAVKAFGEEADVIGFHGQTITHNPKSGFTWQLGDGARLARKTGIPVVYDMRQADIKAGGQGAPLLPLYHAAILAAEGKPVAVLNIGGVANITYIGSGGQEDMLAFDTGPGNALMDDFMAERFGEPFDKNGLVASKGRVQEHLVTAFLRDEYFAKKPPKSLDRDYWSRDCVMYSSDVDGMATLLEMSVRGVLEGVKRLPEIPLCLYVAGGGRRNVHLMDVLASRLPMPVRLIETLGLNGDATEAEGFAYLAVRSLLGEALTLPSTTGVKWPVTGGIRV